MIYQAAPPVHARRVLIWINAALRNGANIYEQTLPHYRLPVVTSDRHFLCRALLIFFLVQRNPLQAIISQDKVAQDFLGIANVP
jgi:hypothetical protein